MEPHAAPLVAWGFLGHHGGHGVSWDRMGKNLANFSGGSPGDPACSSEVLGPINDLPKGSMTKEFAAGAI